MTPFIIDCDTGRDDALTLWVCDALRLPLIGIVSSYGNVSCDQVVLNNGKIRSHFEYLQDVPVFKGASRPLQNHIYCETIVKQRQQSVGNGLSDVDVPGHGQSSGDLDDFKSWLIDYTAQYGKIDYIIIGPATNFAMLLQDKTFDVKDHISRIFMMGGKLSPLWEEMPGADFNIGADPFALDVIIQSGLPFYIVPMNVTWPIADSLNEIKKFVPKSEQGGLAKSIMIAHLEKFAPEPIFRYHDPVLPLVAQKDQSSFDKVLVSIALDETSEDFGKVILSDKPREDYCPVYILNQNEDDRTEMKAVIKKCFFE